VRRWGKALTAGAKLSVAEREGGTAAAVANRTGPAQQREMGGGERREVSGPWKKGPAGRNRGREGKNEEALFFPNRFPKALSNRF